MTYATAYHQARQFRAGGMTSAELQERARRLDQAGQYGAAAAYRAVADE